MTPPPRRPTDAELAILKVLWQTGPATVREIHAAISADKPAQYTTVLKLLQIMTEKGLVRRDEQQRAHVYSAALPEEKTKQLLVSDLLQRAFDGSARGLMMGALSSRKTSKAEIAEIRQLLDEYERKNR